MKKIKKHVKQRTHKAAVKHNTAKPQRKITKLRAGNPPKHVHKTSVRHVLHNLYFSKPYKPEKHEEAKKAPPPKPTPVKLQPKKPGFFASLNKPKPVQSPQKQEPVKLQPKKPDVPIPARPQFVPVADKNLERRLEQIEQYLEKRIMVTEQTVTLIKELFDELKKDNEALRRERTLILEKLSSSSMGMNDPRRGEEEEVEEIALTEKRPMSTFTDSNKSNVNTSLDQLLDMIMEKGSLKISDAAKRLKMKDKQVEEWGKILEEHGLIEIQYPALGKPVLKKKT